VRADIGVNIFSYHRVRATGLFPSSSHKSDARPSWAQSCMKFKFAVAVHSKCRAGPS
jgi:hypothetical protein